MRAAQLFSSSTSGRGRCVRSDRLGRRGRSTRAFWPADRSLMLMSAAHMYRLACSPWRAHERGPSILYDTMYLYALSEPTCDFLWVASYDASSAAIAQKSISRDARASWRGAHCVFVSNKIVPAALACAFTKSMKIKQSGDQRLVRVRSVELQAHAHGQRLGPSSACSAATWKVGCL